MNRNILLKNTNLRRNSLRVVWNTNLLLKGVSYDRIDEVLAPYAELSYKKHLANAIEDEVKNPEATAKKRTIKEIKSAMQSLEYEINTLFSTQGQTPFTTLGFGLGTSWYKREIQIGVISLRSRRSQILC